MRLDLLTLRLFLTVYEESSLTRAAQRENISLSALSKRLSDLEQTLRTTLFDRNHHRMEPRAAADALAPHVRRVLGNLGQIEVEIADFTAGLKGRVRIRSNGWAIIQYLPGDIAAFMASHPLVRVELQEDVSPAIIKAVADNTADIGVFAGDFPAPGLHVLPYRTDRLVVVMPVDHALAARAAVSLEAMGGHDVIGPKPGSAIDALLSRAAAGMELAPRIRVAGPEAVCGMAAARLGIGLVPGRLADRYRRVLDIVVRPLEDAPWATRHLKLCTLPPERLTPAGRQLLDHLQRDGSFAGGEASLPR
jgi:DNA-binding transcriptional LysR family regulator